MRWQGCGGDKQREGRESDNQMEADQREDTISCLHKIMWLIIIPAILECINTKSPITVNSVKVINLYILR